jgi:hypothetical protein
MNLNAEALYELLPSYYRRRDAEMGYPLQALFEIFAREGAQVIDADLDKFADALFVETCAEVLLPRIGALVGAETMRPLPPEAGVSMRAFIGNVLRYRRAKGTAIALEMLARDVTGYSAKSVEYFRKLSVTQTVRAPRPERPATATLRDPDGRARHGGAFDGNPRTPDVRSIARAGGRYNIPNVGLHVWRLEAVPYIGTDAVMSVAEQLAPVPRALPWDGHAGHYALLPEGRAVPLFQPAHNDEHLSPQEQQVPARLRRLPLWKELEDWRAAIARGAGASFQRRWFAPDREPFSIYLRRVGEIEFSRVPAERVMIGALAPDPGGLTPPWIRPPGTRSYPKSPAENVELPVAVVIDPATGRVVLTAPESGKPDFEEVRIAHAVGQPGSLGGGAYDRNDLESTFDVKHGALVFLVGAGPEPPGTRRFATLGAALAQWTTDGADRTGYIIVTENLVDAANAAEPTLGFAMPAGSRLTVVAAEWREPTASSDGLLGFIVRRSRRLMLLRPMVVESSGAPAAKAGELTIDGVYADQGVQVRAGALATLQIRHSVLRPSTATTLDLQGAPGAPLEATLYRSISGRIQADANVADLGLKDSIVATHPTLASIQAPASNVYMLQVTLFGTLAAKTLNASNAILMGEAVVEQRQQGCVRYSYLGGGTTQLPRRYRCQPELAQETRATTLNRSLTPPEARAIALSVRPTFIDTEPEEPAYAQLAMDAPAAITFGGADETEMGAWGFLGGATRLANLSDLIADYLPFGLEACTLSADLSSVEAQRSNVP